MRISLLLSFLCCFFCENASSQDKALFRTLKKGESRVEVQELLKKFKTLCKGDPVVDRYIKEGFVQSYYCLDFTKTLVLLTQHQKIALLLVEEGGKIEILQYWPERVAPLIEEREKIGIEVSKHQFIKEISHRHVFALACGDMTNAEYGPEASLVFKAVYSRDIKPLKKLLGNFNLEMQAYGVMGLLELKAKKVELDTSLLDYVYDLLKYNPTIMTCQGCMSGIPMPLKDLVFQRP
jgi:hypothetical protein